MIAIIVSIFRFLGYITFIGKIITAYRECRTISAQQAEVSIHILKKQQDADANMPLSTPEIIEALKKGKL